MIREDRMSPQMSGMPVTGYVDRWSAHEGQSLRFFVSSEEPEYKVQLVRLIQGDSHPDGPGVKEDLIEASVNGSYPGKVQDIPTGSCMIVDELPDITELALTASIMATMPQNPGQTVFCLACGDGSKLSLNLVGAGTLALEWSPRDGSSPMSALLLGPEIEANQWHHCTLSANLASGAVTFSLKRAGFHPREQQSRSVRLTIEDGAAGVTLTRLLLGAGNLETSGAQNRIESAFNGRIAAPRLWQRTFDEAMSEILLTQPDKADSVLGQPYACWNFVESAGTDHVPDMSGNEMHGRTINRPTRLVTGPLFDGSCEDPLAMPDHFNAAHFHEDDLSDAGWDESFSFTIPDNMKSGIYAMKLNTAQGEDYIPFCITSEVGKPTAKVALLVPTVSYQVYANGRLDPSILPEDLVPLRVTGGPTPADVYLDRYGLRSCYDCHNDGTGVAMASMLRPMTTNARPRSRSSFNNSPHQLAADLYITDWLEEKNIAYDVVTDHELHQTGTDRLADYNVILSGTHAEYWTAEMLDGLKAYTDNGGRFIYLSGNGLYWVTALSEDGTLAEIRRDQGTRSWSAAPGEAYISLTGKRGGLWRHRGRAPQKYVGVGFASQGFGPGQPFTRTPESYNSRAACFFDGIDDEQIGEFPVLISAYGAGAYEFDRADVTQGTPSHAIVLASATGFSDGYQLAVEDAYAMAPFYGGSVNPDVRADMVFYETPKGGAVFSTSSIAWCSGLSYNDYENNVSKLTENVVRTFMKDGPLDL